MSARQWAHLAKLLDKAVKTCPYITSFQVAASICRSFAGIEEAVAIYRRSKEAMSGKITDDIVCTDPAAGSSTGGNE